MAWRSGSVDEATGNTGRVGQLVPEHIARVLGPAPLLQSEDVSRYDALFNQLIVEFDPQGISEWLEVRDICDTEWEIMRLRTAMSAHLNSTAFGDVDDLLRYGFRTISNNGTSEVFRDEFGSAMLATGDGTKKFPVTEHLLGRIGLTLDDLKRSSAINKLDLIQSVHQLLDKLDNRRRRLSRDIRDRKLASDSFKNPDTPAKQQVFDLFK